MIKSGLHRVRDRRVATRLAMTIKSSRLLRGKSLFHMRNYRFQLLIRLPSVVL